MSVNVDYTISDFRWPVHALTAGVGGIIFGIAVLELHGARK